MLCWYLLCLFFFFKQKTAYEMRISDWSSDVCSSDLKGPYEKNPLGRLAGWIQHKLKSNTKKTARKNIAYHYDLGNDFYKLWLDETMAYSSAVFTREPNETLRDAQRNKFREMAQRLNLQPHHHLLEAIGRAHV